MRFSAFLRDNLDAITADWLAFARTLPAARGMSEAALRDHSLEILLAIAAEMETPRSDEARAEQSQDITCAVGANSAAAEHGALRQLAGFDLVQLFAEFRALRASVMALWQRGEGAAPQPSSIMEVTRFNEAMDKALAESVQRYSSEVAASRDMFLAVLGHDLRSPLSGIDLSAILLAKPDLADAPRQRAAERIRRASRSMNRLVCDLLEYTRTRLGAGIPIERTRCDLGPLCDAALADIRIGNPDYVFVHRTEGDLHLVADADRLQQVLANLLCNAVQHGSRQAPVTLAAVGEADAIVVKVGNAGQLIAPEALPGVFEPLVRLPRPGAEPNEASMTSLGLGLFIAREIVLAHGGSMAVDSSTSDGTVFTLRLPRTPG